MKLYELSPVYDSAKSFYGKAKIVEDDSGNKYLFSYNTLVCGFTKNGFERYWKGFSQTTMRHVKEAFRQTYKGCSLQKKDWDSTPISNNQTFVF